MRQFARNFRLFTMLAFVVLLVVLLLARTSPIHDEGRRRLSCAWSAWRHKMHCEAGEERISKGHASNPSPKTHSVNLENTRTEGGNHSMAAVDSNGSSSARQPGAAPAQNSGSGPDSHSDHKEALARGKSLAALYHSPVCLAARSEEQFRELKRVMRWAGQESRWIASPFLSPVLAADGVARLRNASHGKSSAAPTGRPQVVYMRNQKVASTMLDEQTLEYAGAKGEHLRLRFRHDGGSPKQCAPNVFFTFVRDPIATFISGWMQTICFARSQMTRAAKESTGSKSLMWSGQTTDPHPPKMWKDATGAFRAFLDDFRHHRSLGPAASHIWPQAHKVDALPIGCKFNFIGTTENLAADMGALFPRGRLPPHGHKAMDDRCKKGLMATFKITNNDTRQLCEILDVDFKCFGYPRPEVCRSKEWT